MEINKKAFIILSVLFLVSCHSGSNDTKSVISELAITNFTSSQIERCKASDVDLSLQEATYFFTQGKEVPYKVIHDQHQYAPCYIEGTMKHLSSFCTWEISASAVGKITCDDKKSHYYICDVCDAFFDN